MSAALITAGGNEASLRGPREHYALECLEDP
jgi:hypothetical protein